MGWWFVMFDADGAQLFDIGTKEDTGPACAKRFRRRSPGVSYLLGSALFSLHCQIRRDFP